jgi:hypothetical protein
MNFQIPEKSVFDLPNPEEWYCKVLNYPFALTNLRVEARHPNGDIVILEFRNIVYFSGWLSWKGVNFKVADDKEFVDFVRASTSSFDEILDDEVLQPHKLGIFRLFVGKGDKNTYIRFIANAAWATDQSGQTLGEAW